ncbi:hypothetical protein E4U57_000072 [Claviceps arundinis]|uniref:Uncharacterized protein n=1 Tax=Claviceps arundinis TaxID=1623583 RepID=A0ABQ7PQF5_9HYPO|nr:hypothetical protein E4U57_000072 [Claviceps arundinis]
MHHSPTIICATGCGGKKSSNLEDKNDAALIGRKAMVRPRLTLARFSDSDNKPQRSNDGTADPHEFFWTGSTTDVGLGGFQSEDKSIQLACAVKGSQRIGDYCIAKRLRASQIGHGNLWTAIYSRYAIESWLTNISPVRRVTVQVSLLIKSLECIQSAGTESVIASTADENGEVQSKRCGDSSFKVDVGNGGLELLNFKMRGIEMHMQLVYKGTASEFDMPPSAPCLNRKHTDQKARG